MKNKVFLLSFILGCQAPIFTLKIEDEFSEDELRIIKASIEEWKYATDSSDAEIFLSYDLRDNDNELTYSEWEQDRDYAPLWRINSSDEAYIKLSMERGGDFKGTATSGLKIALVPEFIDSSNESLKATMLHELGHFYGIDHLSSGLMVGSGKDLDCIDWRALMEFCNLYYCGPDANPTCQ